jgi:hypothetical protein
VNRGDRRAPNDRCVPETPLPYECGVPGDRRSCARKPPFLWVRAPLLLLLGVRETTGRVGVSLGRQRWALSASYNASPALLAELRSRRQHAARGRARVGRNATETPPAVQAVLPASASLNLAIEIADSGAMTTQITNQMFAFGGAGIVAFIVVARLLLRG